MYFSVMLSIIRYFGLFFIGVFFVISAEAQPCPPGFTYCTSGSLDLTANVPVEVQLSHLKNIHFNLGLVNAPILSGGESVCVYSNATTGYRVKADIKGKKSFELANAADGKNIPFSLRWYNRSDDQSGGGVILNYNQDSTNMTPSGIVPDCGGPNKNDAYLKVVINKSAYEGKPAGDYVADLNLIVSPGV